MIVEFKKEPFEHYIFKDFFSKEELKGVWQDIDFIEKYTAEDNNREETGAALDLTGNPIANRKSIFLNSLFTKETIYSKLNTYKYLRKIYDQDNLLNSNTIGPILKNTNQDSVLVNFYNDGDFYNSHNDNSLFTFLCYLWKDKKDFRGGVLNFENYEYKFDPEFNSGILFPGCITHSIDSIKSVSKNKANTKRISIAMFVGYSLT